MATDKKHIAVYLAPEVEQALIAFCEQKGLKSKKGTMFSAGVNAALAQFFGIADTESTNTPQEINNIPQSAGNIPSKSESIIPPKLSNIPVESLAVEVLPGKLELSDPKESPKPDTEVTEQLQNALGNLKAENENLRADYAALLESSTHITNKLRQELAEVRSQLETVQASPPITPSPEFEPPEAASVLSELRGIRKKTKTDLTDIEVILAIIEKFCLPS